MMGLPGGQKFYMTGSDLQTQYQHVTDSWTRTDTHRAMAIAHFLRHKQNDTTVSTDWRYTRM